MSTDTTPAAIGSSAELGSDQKPRHPSLKPFKCPACGSHYFGPIFENGKHVGRYCKGRPSGWDRSYYPCRKGHEERFALPNSI